MRFLFGLAMASLAALAGCRQPQTEDKKTMTDTTKTTTRMPQPAQTGYADVNGLHMYYEVYGQGKPLVLVHGSFMTIPLNWQHWIPMLAHDRMVVVAEMQGHGRTRDTEREISYEGMADDVSGLLKHLRLDSADILGYSMGGGIAFQMAMRHPEQVRRLVILSGTYRHNGWWPDVEASWHTMDAHLFDGSPIKDEYIRFGNDSAHFPAFLKKVISIDMQPYDWTSEVMALKMPIFMAIGDADGVRYDHALDLFRAHGGGRMGDLHGLPKSRLAILPGTTHIGMMQRPEWLVPMITDFLDSDLNSKPPAF